jgi:hypothetical protein
MDIGVTIGSIVGVWEGKSEIGVTGRSGNREELQAVINVKTQIIKIFFALNAIRGDISIIILDTFIVEKSENLHLIGCDRISFYNRCRSKLRKNNARSSSAWHWANKNR